MEVQHNVQLRHGREEVVQHLDKEVYGFKYCKLIVALVNAHDEVKMRVASQHKLVSLELQLACVRDGRRALDVTWVCIGCQRCGDVDSTGMHFDSVLHEHASPGSCSRIMGLTCVQGLSSLAHNVITLAQ